jgi:glucokinase
LHQVLEEFASGPALVARYNQHSSQQAGRAQEVTEAASRSDPVAVRVVQSAGEALGNSVGFLINLLDLEAVIVGGGLGLTGGLYWSSFVTSTRKHVWSDATRDLPILPALLGTDAGLIGAAATVWPAEASRVRL